jgi:hypothetical protein
VTFALAGLEQRTGGSSLQTLWRLMAATPPLLLRQERISLVELYRCLLIAVVMGKGRRMTTKKTLVMTMMLMMMTMKKDHAGSVDITKLTKCMLLMSLLSEQLDKNVFVCRRMCSSPPNTDNVTLFSRVMSAPPEDVRLLSLYYHLYVFKCSSCCSCSPVLTAINSTPRKFLKDLK